MTTPTDRADSSNRPPDRLSHPANSPCTTRQARFEMDGMRIETPPVEATLTEYAIQVDCRIPRQKIATPAGEAFVDDRSDVGADAQAGQQWLLFPTSDPSQRTLESKPASPRFLFEE
jgi:hypothetical protein